jgi:Mg-chelatase subunit ChlD
MPLGKVDPKLLDHRERQFFSVRTFDELPALAEEAANDGDAAEALAKLAELGKQLLETPATSEPDWLETVRPKPIPVEAGPVASGELTQGDGPDTDQAIDQLADLGNLGFRLPGDGSGDGTGSGTGGEGNGQGASGAAGNLLSQAGLSPAVTRPDIEADIESTSPLEGGRIADQGMAGALDLGGLDLALGEAVDIPTSLDHAFDYEITRYQKPGETSGYMAIRISAKRSLRQLETMPKDVVFLIDVSGSIKQRWVDSIKTGVADALATLGPNDRFNIVFFSEKPRFFASQRIVPATSENIAEAGQFLKRGRSDGFTDLNLALSRLLVPDVSAERAYNLIFISDGQPTRGVMDTRELINLITKDNDRVTGIYTIGVGEKQNKELLDFLSYRNKGFSVFAESDEDAAGVIRGLASQLRYPVLKDVAVQIDGEGISEGVPQYLPNIHQGETFTVFARFNQADRFLMHLTGRNGKSLYDVTLDRALADAQPGGADIARRWAFAKLHQLYSEMLSVEGADKLKLQREIEQLKRQIDLGEDAD